MYDAEVISGRRALDLFCGAGGASVGLARAGFTVVGVDIAPQPNYPFDFVQMDALECSTQGFDFIWASPPCQAFTAYRRRKDHVAPRPNLIPAVRAKLLSTSVPWVIENVPGAPLQAPIQLCGSSFGLDIRRHRIFESNYLLTAPDCDHGWQTPRFPQATNRKNRRRTVEIGVWRIPLQTQHRAMDIDWMTRPELSQAIPPAFAYHIARQANV